jgi:SSS family solute:Na+ symporter
VTQFFPGVVLGLYWKRVTMPGVFAGMIAGVAIVAFLILTNQDGFYGWSAGFVALCVNFVVTAVLSLPGRNSVARDRTLEEWPKITD